MTTRLHNRSDLIWFCKELRNNPTDAEKTLWCYLRARQLGFKFRRQHSVGAYILDFYCPEKRIAVELDGGGHNEQKKIKSDDKRTKYLNKQGIVVKRYWNNEVLVNTEGVLEDILRCLNTTP